MMTNNGLPPSDQFTNQPTTPANLLPPSGVEDRITEKPVPGLPPEPTLAARTYWRVWKHLVPFLFFLYILAYLDRVNVSVAELRMEASPEEGGLGFDRGVIGFGAGIFFWGYLILEVPSTISAARWGARWVFVRILILWGICAALVGFIGMPFAASLFQWVPFFGERYADPVAQFYFLRFMLGFFEGGFFPSVIVYLSHWFRTEDRAKAIATFMAAIPLSQMLGLPLSGLLLDVNWFDLPGWRWIFILQGVAPVLAGVATIFFLPDNPSRAKWLPADERDWLLGELKREHHSKQGHGPGAWVHHLGMVMLLTFVYFCLNLSSYGMTMFMPAIFRSQSGASDKVATFLAALPYTMGLVGMLLNGWHSDRTGERIWHVAVPLALQAVGITLAALCDGITLLPVLLMIFCVGSFLYAHLPAFWPIPTMFLGATTAAAAIGFINMIGNLGGYFGPNLVGQVSKGQKSFAPALLRLAPWPFTAAVIIVVVGYVRRRRALPVKKDI